MKQYDRFTDKYGKSYRFRYMKGQYFHGNGLAIEVLCAEEESDFWEPYCTLTVNLNGTGSIVFGSEAAPKENQAYLDVNNVPDLVEHILRTKKWGDVVGWSNSGYCRYPLVEFTDEFLDRVCELIAE